MPEIHGPIESTVRQDVAPAIPLHPMGEALAALAYKLARTLDGGEVEDRYLPPVTRELRATLVELAGVVMPDADDDLDALLSSPIRDAAHT